ncbi:MAG: class I SAM-dependent methyltransferase [Actinomycetota bacterium]
MFLRSQRFYDAVYSWKDYPAEAGTLHDLIQERRPGARTLLDVACGTGKHLELLREHYEVEGVDLDPEMIAIARERLGDDVPLHVGDMTAFDLGRAFDVVTCLFSSIAYTRTDDRLGEAVANLTRHMAPGGLVIVEPFFPPDRWEEGKVWGNFIDESDLKIARMDISRSQDRIAVIDFHYLVGTTSGIEHFTEHHEIGLFTHEQHLDAFGAAGVEVEHQEEGLMGRGMYVGRRTG